MKRNHPCPIDSDSSESDNDMGMHCISGKRHHPCPIDSEYSDGISDNFTGVRCVSCPERYIPHDAGFCKKCTDGTIKAERELLKEVKALEAEVDLLRFSSSSLNHGTNSRSFTDVVLMASDAAAAAPPIHAHKVVLVSRSPVFKAMLQNDMGESHSGVIKISGVSYNALCTFVNCLYTAEVSLDEQMACELLIVAEKYLVAYLKTRCEEFLVRKVSLKKSLTYYVFAHEHNAKHLLDAALSKITDNMDIVTKREDYKELVKKDSRLVVEIYEAYLSKQAAGTSKSKTV